MSEIVQYERGPGEVGGVAELPEGGWAIVVGPTSVGDPVFPPAEVGGGMRRVAAVTWEPCPLCLGEGREGAVPHYAMDGEDGLGVAECLRHKFVWYRRRA